MSFYYSASTGGVYDMAFHDYDLPADAVEITAEARDALFAAQARGQVIRPDASGHPVAVDPLALLTFDQLKAAKLAELSTACSARMDAIKAGYPADEVQSWDKQESEARAYKSSGSVAATPLLSALSTARGVALSDLADRVIKNADAFAAAAGAIIGKRQKYEDQVGAATDAAGVAAIVWAD